MSGIFGVFGKEKINTPEMINYGLYALQHRGQVSSGIATIDNNGNIDLIKQEGVAGNVFNEDNLKTFRGDIGIGHIKYAFQKEYTVSKEIKKPLKMMPYCFDDGKKEITSKSIIAVDGNIISEDFSYDKLIDILRKGDFENPYLNSILGAYSMVYMDRTKMIAHRDRWGLKPLSLGKIGKTYVVSSESCGLDAVGAEFVRDFEPGDTVIITDEGYKILNNGNAKRKICLFESVYIARPDSYINYKSIYSQRYDMGKLLYKECPIEADAVIGTPDSGLIAAMGFSDESGIPYEIGMIKNRYIGRTFIFPSQKERERGVSIKLNPIKTVIDGKDIVLVDDSIVRGTTIKRTIKMLKDAGAKKVHVRISSPIVKKSCNLSVDTPSEEHLIGSNRTCEEICKIIEADSLYFLSLKGTIKASGNYGYCTHCFTGEYPIDLEKEKQNADI